MTRKECLEEAIRIVTKDRNATHGEPEDSFATIAALWSTYIGKSLSSHDVAAMMILLKVARIKYNPTHLDSHIDIAGYAACSAEVIKNA